MKTHRALVIGLVFTAAMAAQAQDLAVLGNGEASHSRDISRKVLNLQKYEVNYLACLNSEIPGVIESALGHITLMRIEFPKQDLRRIQQKLYDLASRGATQTIRHKAFTAMQVFADPTAYKSAIAGREYNGDGLLEEIAGQL